MRYIFFFVPLLLIFFPSEVAQAQLISCTEGNQCNFCHLAYSLDKVVNWLVVVATLIATIGLMYAGFRMATSRGDVSTFTYAKEMFGNVVIGLFIIAMAWTIVDVIIKSVTGGDLGVWNEPAECGSTFRHGTPQDGVQLRPEAMVELTESPSTITDAYYSPDGTSNISSFSGNLVNVDGHLFDQSIVSQVNYIARTYNLRISGGHRTAARNSAVGGVPNSLHLTGRAADFVGSSQDMRAALSWARANGAREALIHDAGSGTHLHVGW